MQPNIPMKFAGYVAWILLCKCCKFGDKIYYNSGDIEFFLGDYFFLARPVYLLKFSPHKTPILHSGPVIIVIVLFSLIQLKS